MRRSPSTKRLRRRLGAVTVGLTFLGAVVSPTAAHASTEPTRHAPRPDAVQTKNVSLTANNDLRRAVSAAGGTVPVTLVTGDKVDVGVDDHGNPVVRNIESVPRPDGTPVVFHTITHEGNVLVVPNDALGLLDQGLLDWKLFDLTDLVTLVASGRTSGVPVIVTYTDKSAVAKAPKVAGATGGRTLASINGRSMKIADTGRWWQQVKGRAGSGSTGRSAGSLAGVKKVWLNELARVSLDISVPQIGAPAAWKRGYDGTGVDVAVLDSGVDATHPDLAGKIVEQVDFTGNPDGARDGNGHGTHVASTILGSGAASDGLRKGVAPGAKLRVGKVCDDQGACPLDATLAGMEWAAHSGAKVVNMSLGTATASDGTDLQSETLNQLSRETGTLFVVAAGNEGPGGGTIGSPGAADDALTVAAVDKQDKMASFSSRGPRIGDSAAKPDIAAPGVDIVAARAAGTTMGTPVDEYYTTASGTSMATPHVVGAAAIVAQQHPDLTGQEIKALLMGSATDLGYDASAQGTGRVDLANAIEQQVVAGGNLSFGRLTHPHSAVTRKVTYINLNDQATTLNLSASLSLGDKPAPAGLLTLSTDEVALPANGSAEVSVKLDGRVLGDHGDFGRYEGLLKAQDSSGTVQATSGVHALLEAPRSPLTVNVIPPTGATNVSYGQAVFMPVDDKVLLHDGLVTAAGADTITASLYDDGAYSATVPVSWQDTHGNWQRAAPVVPEVRLTKATTVTLDLRKAKPVSVQTPETTENYSGLSSTERVSATGAWKMATSLTAGYDDGEPNWWALPTDKVHTGTLTQNTYSVRTTPVVTMRAVGGGGTFSLPARYQTPDSAIIRLQQTLDPVGMTGSIRNVAVSIPRLPSKGHVPVVYAGTGSAAELANVKARGKLVLLTPTDICQSTCDFPKLRDERVAAAAAAGAIGVLVAAPDLTSLGAAVPSEYDCLSGLESCPKVEPYAALPIVKVAYPEADRLIKRIKADQSNVDILLGGSAAPKVYAARFVADGQIPSDLQYRLEKSGLDRVDHYFHADRPGEMTKLNWQQQSESAPTEKSMGLPLTATQQTLTLFVQRQKNAIDQFTTGWADHADNSVLVRARSETQDVVLADKNELHWNAGPSVPGAVMPVRTESGFSVGTGPCSGCRQGDTFYPTFYLSGSGGGRQALIGVLNDDGLTSTLFGITACGPDVPASTPTVDATCDFRLLNQSGDEVKHRTERFVASGPWSQS